MRRFNPAAGVPSARTCVDLLSCPIFHASMSTRLLRLISLSIIVVATKQDVSENPLWPPAWKAPLLIFGGNGGRERGRWLREIWHSFFFRLLLNQWRRAPQVVNGCHRGNRILPTSCDSGTLPPAQPDAAVVVCAQSLDPCFAFVMPCVLPSSPSVAWARYPNSTIDDDDTMGVLFFLIPDLFTASVPIS